MKNTRLEKSAPAEQRSASRRKFLKQGLMFAALTATYSVVSLTELGCHSSDNPVGPSDSNIAYYGVPSFHY